MGGKFISVSFVVVVVVVGVVVVVVVVIVVVVVAAVAVVVLVLDAVAARKVKVCYYRFCFAVTILFFCQASFRPEKGVTLNKKSHPF